MVMFQYICQNLPSNWEITKFIILCQNSPNSGLKTFGKNGKKKSYTDSSVKPPLETITNTVPTEKFAALSIYRVRGNFDLNQLWLAEGQKMEAKNRKYKVLKKRLPFLALVEWLRWDISVVLEAKSVGAYLEWSSLN